MAVNAYYPGNSVVYLGLSTDPKPAAGIGSKFIETDTKKVWLLDNTGTWQQVGVFAATTSIGVLL